MQIRSSRSTISLDKNEIIVSVVRTKVYMYSRNNFWEYRATVLCNGGIKVPKWSIVLFYENVQESKCPPFAKKNISFTRAQPGFSIFKWWIAISY